jgi:hypothetical protein
MLSKVTKLNFCYTSGLEISGCAGCKILWQRRMNVTVRPVKKVRDNKIVTRLGKKLSDFHMLEFFLNSGQRFVEALLVKTFKSLVR